jgi:hypothetical protein
MDKCHLEAEEPLARPLVDQSGSRTGQLGQRRIEVADLVRNVMHARAALGKEAADRRIVGERLEELHPPAADLQRSRAHALGSDSRAMFDLCPEEALVRGEGFVEIFDCNT